MRDHVFARLVDGVVLGVAASLASGCAFDSGSAPEEPERTYEDFYEGIEPLACVSGEGEGGWPDFLGAVRATEAFDAIELRFLSHTTLAVAEASVEQSSGALCGSAGDDRDTCLAALEALDGRPAGFRFGDCPSDGSCFGHVLVATQGAEVTVIDDAAGVLAWLGEIDTPVEAAWLARLAGYRVGCGDRPGISLAEGDRWGVREAAGGGHDVLALRTLTLCPHEEEIARLHVATAGEVEVIDAAMLDSHDGLCVAEGRRPAGWRASRARGRSAVGAHLARVAELEAASVAAFRHIEAELKHHRAPASLRRAARHARADEVRHALTTRRLARRAGAVPQRPAAIVFRPPPRDLRALALDNAREGCAREAYGAVVARWQSVHAADAQLRAALAGIARDEARHAAFSLRLDRWLRPRLDAAARAEVEQARAAAFEDLRREIAEPPDSELVTTLGLPPPAVARRLLDALAADVRAPDEHRLGASLPQEQVHDGRRRARRSARA